MLVHFLEIYIKMIVDKFDKMKNNFFIVFNNEFCIYLNTSQYDNTLFPFTLFACLK